MVLQGARIMLVCAATASANAFWPEAPLNHGNGTSVGAPYHDPARVVGAGAGWVADWNDNFDTFNTQLWHPGSFARPKQNEKEWYTSDECSVQGGNLVLRTQERKMNGYNYTSCWVDTRGSWSQQYGLFEVRAKLPHGQGMWPAHWLLPDDKSCWPAHGEVDIMENLGNKMHTFAGTYHWNPDGRDACTYKDKSCSRGFLDMGVDLSAGFHTYGLELAKDKMNWWFDGKLVQTCHPGDGGSYFPPSPLYFVLNTAVGGWAGEVAASFPQYHYIDRVTHYHWASADEVYLAV